MDDVARERGSQCSRDHDVLCDRRAGRWNGRDLEGGLAAGGVDRPELHGANRKSLEGEGAVGLGVCRAAVLVRLEEDALRGHEGVGDRHARLVEHPAGDVAAPQEHDVDDEILPRCSELAERVAVVARRRVGREDLEDLSLADLDVLEEKVTGGVRRGRGEIVQEGLARRVGHFVHPEDDRRARDRLSRGADDDPRHRAARRRVAHGQVDELRVGRLRDAVCIREAEDAHRRGYVRGRVAGDPEDHAARIAGGRAELMKRDERSIDAEARAHFVLRDVLRRRAGRERAIEQEGDRVSARIGFEVLHGHPDSRWQHLRGPGRQPQAAAGAAAATARSPPSARSWFPES